MRSRTSSATATSAGSTDSSGWWLIPPAQRTNSIATGMAADSATASWPAPLTSRGAGHDAVALAPLLPVSMLFVRCAGGVSHHPDEAVDVADVAVALDVLDRFLRGLAG